MPDVALNLNVENFATLSHPTWQIVALLLMVGYGAHFAFSVFFLASSTQLAPKYRLGTWLSAVVMLAAGLSLLRESSDWSSAYVFSGSEWIRKPDEVFSNSYRYANWTVTIPLLLAQLLLALDLDRSRMHKSFAKLVIAAVLMIWAGLIGQFYEHTSVVTLLIWGFVSTLPFVYLVWGVWRELEEAKKDAPTELRPWHFKIFLYFLFFWGLYPLAYMIPAVTDGEVGIVLRQFMFTTADVFSKLVYGVILARYVLRRSAAEGYVPAMEALGRRSA